MEFTEILRDVMGEFGLNQVQLSRKINVDQSRISAWLRGISKPSYEHLQNLCIKLGVSGDRVLGLENV